MRFSGKDFARYLALYGADISLWPEALRAQAQEATSQPAYARLIREHRQLEATLADRPLEPARYGLAERIIASARYADRAVPFDLFGWLKQLFADSFMPRPAYALPAVLLIGVFIGLGTLEESSASAGFDYTTLMLEDDDEGDIL